MEKSATKVCTKCGINKALSEFDINPRSRSGGYLSRCRDCNKKYHKEYYEKRKKINADKVNSVNINETKICISCKEEKPLNEFSFDKASGKFINTCKKCKASHTRRYYKANREQRTNYAKEYRENHQEQIAEQQKKYRMSHLEERRAYSRQYGYEHKDEISVKRRAYRLAHKDEFRERDKKYAQEHKEQISERYKEWRLKHAEQLAQYNKQYRAEHADEISEKRRKADKKNRKRITRYYLNKRQTDPLFKLSTQVRGLIRVSLKNRGYSKNTHTYEILGCDYETLWEHLLKSWQDNYGTEWNDEPYHIDHIIPLATAKTEQEVLDLCYYKNLQMLKPKDNLSKNARLDWKLK